MIKSKIMVYNFLTAFFGIFTFLSFGSIANYDGSIWGTIIGTPIFATLTYICYVKENKLRERLSKKTKTKKLQNIKSI